MPTRKKINSKFLDLSLSDFFSKKTKKTKSHTKSKSNYESKLDLIMYFHNWKCDKKQPN